MVFAFIGGRILGTSGWRGVAWRASMERLTLAGEREFYEYAVSIFIRKGWERMGIPTILPGVLFRSGPDVMIRFAEALVFSVAICERTGEWRVYDRFC